MVFMLPAILISTMGALGLGLWAHRLGGRYGCPRWVRLLPWPIALTWLSGSCAATYGFITAFGAVPDESVDASDKARVLAQGISEAMNGIAFAGMGLGAWALVMLGLTYKFHWGARGPKIPGDPPYR